MQDLAESVVLQAAEPLFVCDTTGCVRLASRAAHDLCGTDPTGQSFQAVLPLRLGRAPAPWRMRERRKSSHPGPLVSLADVLRGDRVRGKDVIFDRPDGVRFHLLMSAAPLVGTQGEPAGSIITLTDISARARAESALQQRESQFTRLAEADVIGIVTGDENQVLEANPAFLRLLGYAEEYPLRAPLYWHAITPPEYQVRDAQALQELVVQGTITPYEKEYLTQNGTRVPVLLGATLLESSPFRWAGFVLDLSKYKRAEGALRETERQFRETLENVRMIAVMLDPQARVTFCNDFLLELTGWSREEVIGQNWFDLFIPAGHPVQQLFANAMQAEPIPPHYNNEIVTRRGERRHIAWNNILLRDLDGNPSGTASIGDDITERTRVEAELREREEQFRALADNSPDLIQRLDHRFIHRYANPAAAKLMRQPPQALVGKTLEQAGLAPSLVERWHKEVQKVLDSGQPGQMDFAIGTEQGMRFFQARLVPERGLDQTVSSVLVVSRDLTSLKQAEEALQEANLTLEMRVEQRTAEVTESNRSLQALVAERSRVEAELAASRAQFKVLLESAPDAIVTVNQNGEMVLVNSETEKMFGYLRTELIGRSVEMLIPSRYRERHMHHREHFDADPATRPMGIGLSLVGRRKDGTEFPVEISLSPVQTQGAALVTSIIRDITERKQAEAVLERQAARLQEQADLLNSAHDTIMMRDLESRITFWNHGAEELYGWTRDQALGQVTHSLLQTRSALPLEEITHRLLAEGRWEGELEHTTRGGERHIVSSRQVLKRDAAGQPQAILEINRDITQRKQMEEALRQSEDRLRALIEQVKEYAILGLDPEGRVTSWNAGAERITGYRADEIIGRPFSQFYPAADLAAGKPSRELSIAAAEGKYQEEGLRVRKNGTTYWAEVVITALRNPDGQLRGFAKVTRDITERRQAEGQILHLNQELETRVNELAAVNQELEAFSYSVSHDLRSPLRGIAGFAQALVEDYAPVLDEQGRDYTQRIQAATQRMTQLIDDLLNLSRVTRGEMNRDAIVDLTAMAHSIARQLRSAQPQREVDFLIQEGLEVSGDSRLLRIAMENLFENAWKFTVKRSPAHIEFGARESENGQTEFYVRDNGAGFDMAYAGKLFGPFQRMHSTAEFPGTGIGLATVQRILRRHGGRVWAESAVDQGTTIHFTLPPGGMHEKPSHTTRRG